MDFTGKKVIVTGSSRGIGRDIAIEFAKKGAWVVVNYKEDEEGAKDTLNSIKSFGGNGIILKADVSLYGEAEKLIEDTVKNFGGIDILVNNAGISKIGLFIDTDEDLWNELIDSNLKSVYNCCHSVLKYMLPSKKGNIINISSIWGGSGASCEVIYSASKGGINAFTKALAKEIGPSGIRVNAIAPGVIDTEMNSHLSIDERKEIEDAIPLNCYGTGKDIANLVLFLCAEESSYITGQIFNVDGGGYN